VSRAASVFPTSPPQQDKRARSGTLQLCSASKQTPGETNTETHWGKTRNPPGPGKPRPGSRSSPRPLFLPPQTNRRPVRMTVECARHRPRIPRRTCRTRKLQGARGTRETPKARFPRFPRTPSCPSPSPMARCARQNRLEYRADPGHHGNQQSGPPAPDPFAAPVDAETAGSGGGHSRPGKASCKHPGTGTGPGATRPPSPGPRTCATRPW
jgi:hypothetical protein